MTVDQLEKQILILIQKLEKSDIAEWSYDPTADLFVNPRIGVKCNVLDSSTGTSTKFCIDDFKITLGSGTKGTTAKFRSFLKSLKFRLAAAKVEKAIKMFPEE